jgi:hypothetical protein
LTGFVNQTMMPLLSKSPCRIESSRREAMSDISKMAGAEFIGLQKLDELSLQAQQSPESGSTTIFTTPMKRSAIACSTPWNRIRTSSRTGIWGRRRMKR